MGYFEVIKRDGTTISLLSKEPFCVVKSATQETTLMGDDVVKMSVVSTELLNFEKGDKIEVGGYAYTIRTAVSREMIAESHYLYEITFYGAMYDLRRVVYRDTDLQGRSSKNTFDLTYSAREFVNVLMNNLNRDFKGEWKFDLESCPETDTRTIQFAKQNCLQALQRICSEFSLEFCIYQKNGVKTLKVGYFGETINPLSGEQFFEWGRGLGLYSLKEDKVDENSQITRLWVEGSANNIKTDYRGYAGRLQLPYPRRKNKMGHRLFDGSFVQPNTEYIGISNDSDRFIEDHALRISGGSEEDVAIYDDIYPHRTGSVTGLVNNDINAFVDATMDFDLMERTESGTKYLIDGVSAKITFISGKLSGQQFELAKKNGYNHSQRKFVLIPAEDGNGGFIPTTQNTSLRIAVGDKYKITDILLPQNYIDDAEEILWYKANKDFEERKRKRVQYQLTLDRLYLLEHAKNPDFVFFRVGDHIPIKDERFKVEGNIRVQKVVRNLLTEQDYTLTLSNSVSRGRSSQILSNLLQLNDNVKEIPSKIWIYSSLLSKASIDDLAMYATLDFTRLSLEKKAEKSDLATIQDTFNSDLNRTVSAVFTDRKSELKGKDGAGAHKNLLKGYRGTVIDFTGATAYEYRVLVPEKFLQSGKNYLVVADYTCTSEKKPDFITLFDYFVTVLRSDTIYTGNPTRVALFVPASDRSMGTRGVLGYSGKAGNALNVSSEYSNIMLLEWGDSWDGVIPPYFPHVDDLKVTADEVSASLIASNDFKANLSATTAQILNADSVFKASVKGEKGDKGEQGVNGVDGTSVTLADLNIRWNGTSLVVAGVESGSLKGAKGADGKSVTIADLKANASFMQHTAREVAKFGEFATTEQLSKELLHLKREFREVERVGYDPYTVVLESPELHEEGKIVEVSFIESNICQDNDGRIQHAGEIYTSELKTIAKEDGFVLPPNRTACYHNHFVFKVVKYRGQKVWQWENYEMLKVSETTQKVVEHGLSIENTEQEVTLLQGQVRNLQSKEIDNNNHLVEQGAKINTLMQKSNRLEQDVNTLKIGKHKITVKSLRNASIVPEPLNTLQMTHSTTANSLYLPSPSEGLCFRLWANHWVDRTITIRKPSFPSNNFLINTATNTQISSLTLIAGHLYDFVAVNGETWLVTDLSR